MSPRQGIQCQIARFTPLHSDVNLSAVFGPIAQWSLQRTHNPGIVGSNPTGATANPVELLVLLQQSVKDRKKRKSTL